MSKNLYMRVSEDEQQVLLNVIKYMLVQFLLILLSVDS